MSVDNKRVAPERYQNNSKPSWLDKDSIPMMNTDSPLIRQYIDD